MDIGTLIVDDQEDMRLLIRLVIEAANEGLVVNGEATTGLEAVERAGELDPTVIVLDEMMPGMNGLEAAAQIMQQRPGQLILLCSAYLDDDLRRRAREVGIAVCLTKDEIRKIPEAIQSLARAG